MMRERGLSELYADDPERADALLFGRRVGVSRRGFLQGAGLAAMGAAVGGAIPFAGNMPAGLVPAALAQAAPAAGGPDQPPVLKMDGKAGLIVLQDRPLNAETPAHLLDDEVTPTANLFVRNNGIPPENIGDPKAWKITIDGEVNRPLTLTLGELTERFRPVTYQLQLECGGNGRSAFYPEARGNQWLIGAVGCAEWTGVPLRDVLKAAEPKPSAVYTAHYGADTHLSGDPDKPPISRGVRLPKAMDEFSIIAFQVNGEPIPLIHGGPVRVIYPGWAGSASHKWLTRIWIRDREHDGPGMTGTSYRYPTAPIVPGSKHDGKGFAILESMPVRSVITSPANGTELPDGTRRIDLRGAAWAGDLAVRTVEVSIDYGSSWQKADLKPPRNDYAWQRWTAQVELPTHGYYEIWARATDQRGRTQPFQAANWNPQGYGGNAYHRVAVLVKA